MPVWVGKPYKYTKPDLPPSERDQVVIIIFKLQPSYWQLSIIITKLVITVFNKSFQRCGINKCWKLSYCRKEFILFFESTPWIDFFLFDFWIATLDFRAALFSRALYSKRARRKRERFHPRFISTPSLDPLPVTSINQRYRDFPSALITIMIPARTLDKDPNTDASSEPEMFTIQLSPGTLGRQSLSSCYLPYEKSRTQSAFPFVIPLAHHALSSRS